MPIYEYRCESCGETLEKIQKFSDAPLTDCPACGKSTLKKLVSASSFRLKGSGWYETDFKAKKSTKDAKADKSNTSGKSSTADSSSSKSDGGSGKSQASGSD